MGTAEVILENDSEQARPKYLDARAASVFLHTGSSFLTAVAARDARLHWLGGIDPDHLRARFVFEGPDDGIVQELPLMARNYLRQPEMEPGPVKRALTAFRRAANNIAGSRHTVLTFGSERVPVFNDDVRPIVYTSVTQRRVTVVSLGLKGRRNEAYQATVRPTSGGPSFRISVDRHVDTMRMAVGRLADLRLRIQYNDHVPVSGELLAAEPVGSSTFNDMRNWYRETGVRHVGRGF